MIYEKKKTKEISFPIGGIGTGSIGLSGNGNLIDWEIFNRPSKGSINGHTNFIVRADAGDKSVTKALHGDELKDFMGKSKVANGHFGFGYGSETAQLPGMPHFEKHTFRGTFPVASIDFESEGFPGGVTLTAFNPFIPLNADDSSIPAAFFEIEFCNDTENEVNYTAAFTLQNPFEDTINEKISHNSIMLKTAEYGVDDAEYGDMSVAAVGENVELQPYWYRGNWMDGIVTFWHEFAEVRSLSERVYDDFRSDGRKDVCAVSASVRLCPGQRKSVKFVLTWNIPNYVNYWNGTNDTWKNYYATLFEDSSKSLEYCIDNYERLREKTMEFKDVLFSSTLDEAVLDAVSATMSVLKSPTVLRLPDGSFWGWEGVSERIGSCEGTCTHVWTYAYALCFLFPELERSIRNYEFKYSADDDGRMIFRTKLPLGCEDKYKFYPCVDGQMGSVFKVYREWKISGDDEWLKSVWDKTKSVLEFAWSEENPHMWDRDKDGVLEGRQHHTLDMELYGPSSWLEGFYLAALKAAGIMAEHLGDFDKHKEYTDLFDKGYAFMKEQLFNGKYFIQKVDIEDKDGFLKYVKPDKVLGDIENDEYLKKGLSYWNEETGELKYQIGEGCEIDQMCAQWHANILGLGELYDSEQKKTALLNLYKNNFKPSMRNFVNPWRVFAQNDDGGAVICDYPEDVRMPVIPIPYSGEAMHGFEYQLAGLLISEGMIEEGLSIVRSVRNRYNGEARNPWNEIECGSNYARSMASFALLPIFSGFEFDIPHGKIGFNPKLSGDFKCLWSLGTGWGSFEKRENVTEIIIKDGFLKLCGINLPYLKNVKSVVVDGREVDFEFKEGFISFGEIKTNSIICINS